MRQYYQINKPKIVSKRMGRFSKKHSASLGFEYGTCGGWGPVAYLKGIPAYKENGTFYEFFTGYELGKEVSLAPGTTHLIGNVFPPLKICVAGEYEDSDACVMSESSFAAYVKPHMKERKYVAKMMREYLEICRAVLIDNERAQREKEVLKQLEQDTSWLDSFLDKR